MVEVEYGQGATQDLEGDIIMDLGVLQLQTVTPQEKIKRLELNFSYMGRRFSIQHPTKRRWIT